MNTKATSGVHTFLITHRECMVTKPVILDVVQYEGVKPLDKGAIERFARMSGVTDWKRWRGSTTRAPIEPKICLLRFFDSVNPAGNSIIQKSLWPICGYFLPTPFDHTRIGSEQMERKTI